MTSEIPSRRSNDLKLDEVLDRIDQLEEGHRSLAQHQSKHLDEYHAFKKDALIEMVAEHNALVEGFPQARDDIEAILYYVAGEKVLDPITHEWFGERKGGMAARITKLEYDANGGRGLSIRNRDKLIIALLSTVGAIIVAALQTIG